MNPTCPVRLRAQPFARCGSRNTSGPDDCLAHDPFTANDHSIAIDVFDAVSQSDFDTQAFEMLLRFSGESLGERAEDPVGLIHQDNACVLRINPSEGFSVRRTSVAMAPAISTR